MKVLFVQPAVGHKRGRVTYPQTWIMEPLWAATIAALLPRDCERALMDDRLGEVDYEASADLVLLSVECYTAKRAYEIADLFRARGAKVALGGFHVTLNPDEAASHADAVLVGSAEAVWDEFWSDFVRGELKHQYEDKGPPQFGPLPDRSVFGHHRYGLLGLVETSRGCRLDCEFCSICQFFRHQYVPRDLDAVIADVRACGKKVVFFVDDNLAMDIPRLKDLCRRMRPLGLHWVGQLGLNAAEDEELLELMAASGCAGVLIGFESLSKDTLRAMGKGVNRATADYSASVAALRRHRLSVYATFVFGYDEDDEETFKTVYEFALKSKFFFAAFNHLVPFPGTNVYRRLKDEGRLLSEKWWLDPAFTFGDVAFRPRRLSAERLSELCNDYRLKFYSLPSVLRRGWDFGCNTHGLYKALMYFVSNFTQEREVARRRGLPWGGEPS